MSSLNFIIIKINGIDVSSLPHDEAVQLFLRAQEPILVEVRRRNSDDVNKLTFFNEDSIPPSCNNSVPLTAAETPHKSKPEDAAAPAEVHCSTVAVSTELVVSNQFEETASPRHACYSHQHGGSVAPPFAECLGPEIDIEEITLRKSRSDEKLGFTVSYSSGNGSASESNSECEEDDDNDIEDEEEDTCADIYISDILPDSLAARDGRLRQGDQILQINGRDVSNKDETESLFAENKNAVTLLVSRCLYTSFQDDEFLDSAVYCDDKECQNPGNQSSSCECEQNTFSSKSSISNCDPIPAAPQHPKLQTIAPIDTTDMCDHANIKAQLESVNKEISLLNSQISSMKLQKPLAAAAATPKDSKCVLSSAAAASNLKSRASQRDKDKEREPPRIPFIPAPPLEPDFEHIYETIPEDSETDTYYCSPYESKEQSRVEQWLKSQSDSTATLKNSHLSQTLWKRVCKNNSSGDDYENSSSAYNTGGSCNSNPLTFELKADDKNQSSSTLVFRPYSRQLDTMDNCKHCQVRSRVLSREKLSPKFRKGQLSAVSKNDVQSSSLTIATSTSTSKVQHSQALQQKSQPSSGGGSATPGTLYTNVENLHQTIKLQQKLFRKALVRQSTTTMMQQAQSRRSSSGAVTVIAASATTPFNTLAGHANQNFIAPSLSQYHFVGSQDSEAEQMVWKVKRRPDGSRYIVRRPVKSQLLQDRARRIYEERNAQTTEDETTSEVKVGRYWTKDERKRHVEKSKERRQRQEMMIAAKKHETQQWVV